MLDFKSLIEKAKHRGRGGEIKRERGLERGERETKSSLPGSLTTWLQ